MTEPRRSWARKDVDLSSLLFDVLLAGSALIEFRSFAIRNGDAESLLQPLARLKTVSAGIAFGLYGRLALRRDDDFNDPHGSCSFEFGDSLFKTRHSKPLALHRAERSTEPAHPAVKRSS